MSTEKLLDLIDEYGRTSQEAGRADMSIGYDPGRHYKYEECDQAKGELVAAVDTLSRQLAAAREALDSTIAAMPPYYAYGDNEAACWMADRLLALRAALEAK